SIKLGFSVAQTMIVAQKLYEAGHISYMRTDSENLSEDAIKAADYIVDIGPGAGEHGGEIIGQGNVATIINNKNSLTGRYLSGELQIETPPQRRTANNGYLNLIKASGNNLKQVNLSIPIGNFVCITGVSGSGKSTLINDTLYKALASRLYGSNDTPSPFAKLEGDENFDKVINVDQSPIGRTPRSNPATYTGVFTFIRDLFTQVNLARERGYLPGRFSFNVKGGRCETCTGDGLIKVEMHFLPDIYVICDTCKGKRYNRETLEILYKGKNIHEVLQMTVETAAEFFKNIPSIYKKLTTLLEVGLGYIRLGQSATTLSGGEAQRVKLALELSKRDTGNTMYILDEPTTGLHFQDISLLLKVLHKFVDHGNTVVVIEHNLDVIKTADWVIDLGPEGGEGGGTIIASGTPEDLVKTRGSYTGKYLALGNKI
nr:excinuclease ABC subunit UvrA [Burkholderiales bacterium]